MKQKKFETIMITVIGAEIIIALILVMLLFARKNATPKMELHGDSAGVEESTGEIERDAAAMDVAENQTKKAEAEQEQMTLAENDNETEEAYEETSEGMSEEGTEAESEPMTQQQQDPGTPEGRAAAMGLPKPPEIDINSWEYMLVNTDHPLDQSYVPEIAYVSSMTSASEQDARIAQPLGDFVIAAEAQGLPVYLSSGYRSYADQEYLFNLKLQQYDYDTAATIVAIPGTSEHQTGLCCDITDIYRSPKNSELENTDTYRWMSEHCAEYGFIVRFPKGKEDITGIIYEPWHFRYVGKEAAAYITENNLTLEEFWELYQGEE